jgi:hypothetical protein
MNFETDSFRGDNSCNPVEDYTILEEPAPSFHMGEEQRWKQKSLKSNNYSALFVNFTHNT